MTSQVRPSPKTQSLPESCLFTGPLEPTNEWYAIAKIAGLKLCQAYRRQHGSDFVSVMPTNLYGPNDNFDSLSSHVLPALIAKIDGAVLNRLDPVEIWGSGRPRRESLHVDDLTDAVVFLMTTWSEQEPINIGMGTDVTIADLAQLIAEVVGFTGRFVFDDSKPDGTPRKLLDVSRLTALGCARGSNSRPGLNRPTSGTEPPARQRIRKQFVAAGLRELPNFTEPLSASA